MKSILYFATTVSISIAASVVNAQTSPSAGSLNQFDRSPIQQPREFSNPNGGSRQFFQQGRDNLYFLEESELILQIDRENEPDKEVEEGKIQKPNETLEPAE